MNISKFYTMLALILCFSIHIYGSHHFEKRESKKEHSLFAPITIITQVSSSADDVEEDLATGDLDLVSTELNLGMTNNEGKIVGIRFNALEIPRYSQIVNAYIQFTSSGVSSDITKLKITAEAANNAPPFLNFSCGLSSKSTTLSSVFWNPAPWNTIGASSQAQRSPNLASLIQEVVSRNKWEALGAISFFITGTGGRQAVAYDGNPDTAPRLIIEYESDCRFPPIIVDPFCADSNNLHYLGISVEPTLWTGGVPFNNPLNMISTVDTQTYPNILLNVTEAGPFANTDTTDLYFFDPNQPSCNFSLTNISYDCGVKNVFSKIRTSSDDAEEMLSSGDVFLISNDLNMVDKPSGKQLVGLRFQKLKIPQGAEIQNAYLQFTSDEIGLDPAELIIRAENSEDAPTFENEEFNISSRLMTTEMATWIPKKWDVIEESGTCQQTSDISNVIQEVVNKIEWTEESALALFVDGMGLRTALSFDGCPECAAELYVEYKVRCEKPETEIILLCDPTNNGKFYMKVALLGGVDTAYALQHNQMTEIDTFYIGEGKVYGPFQSATNIDMTLTSVSDSTCIFYYLNMTEDCICTDRILVEDRFIQTTPFVNTTIELKDGEGMAIVPMDKSVWIGDDNGQQVVEVDYITGELKQVISAAQLEATPQFGGSNPAGSTRVNDIEAIAHDAKLHEIFVLSGSCCPGDGTVFRLLKNSQGVYEPFDFQPLSPPDDDFSGAALHPNLGLLLGRSKTIKQYNYMTNSFGNTWSLVGTGFTGTILGLGVADDGATLWIVSDTDKLFKFDWNNLELQETYDLIDVDILDGRGVDYFLGQIYILDGFVTPPNPEKKFAVTIFDIECADPDSLMSNTPSNNNFSVEENDNNVFNGNRNSRSVLSLAPNPTSNILNVQITSETIGIAEIHVSDIFGRTLLNTGNFELEGVTTNKEINVSFLPPGVFSINLQMSDGTQVAKFFMKN